LQTNEFRHTHVRYYTGDIDPDITIQRRRTIILSHELDSQQHYDWQYGRAAFRSVSATACTSCID
jgi:hypothetical protein